MSEPTPASIPTSTSRVSHRPTKKARNNKPALSEQSHSLAVLFANADREITLPPPSSANPTAQSAATALSAAPEIVPNVQGSSAGAGSGEFHVYKAARRREYERLKAMDEEVQAEEERKEWEVKKEKGLKKEEKRMGKNRKAREKAKARKAGKGVNAILGAAGKDGETENGINGDVKNEVGRKLGARLDVPARGGEDGNGDGAAADMPVAAANPDEIGLMIHDDED